MLNQHIQAFSQIHQYDEPEQLLNQFEAWIAKEPICTLVAQEQTYLSRHHYDLPIDLKIFKSIKYYYIKKENKDTVPPTTEPRKVTRLPKEVLSKMTQILDKAFSTDPTFKPSKLFQPEDYPEEIPLDALKKAFNNQYYQMKHKKYGPTIDV